MHLGIEALEGDLRRSLQGVQAQPREILPVQLRIGAQALLPVSRRLQLDPLVVVGGQVQGIEPGAFTVHQPGQGQGDRRLFGGQAGRARQVIALEQIALGVELQLVQLQSVGQRASRLECLGADLQGSWQVFGQCLQLAAQRGIEVTTAAASQFQGFLQFTAGSQCQLPRLALYRRQLQLRLQLQRPVTFGLQVALQVQIQVVALQPQAVDAHPAVGPVRRELQVAKQFAAIQAQLTNLDLAQLDSQWQAQGRQLQRCVVGGFGAWRKAHVDAFGLQPVDAQRGA